MVARGVPCAFGLGRIAESSGRWSRRVRSPHTRGFPTRVGVSGRSDLASARAIDDDEPRASDRSTARNRSRHDRVRPRRQSFAADPGGDPNTVYSPVAPDPETSDAAAVGLQLEDDELNECPPSKDEYELRAAVGPGAGDVSGGADFPPTDTSVNVMESIEKDLNGAKADYKNLMDRDVPAFNRAIGGAITPLTGR